jgi:hypothetical protein
MIKEVIACAEQIEAEQGADIDAAITRWNEEGGFEGGRRAAPWLSVAFLFGRRRRSSGGAKTC